MHQTIIDNRYQLLNEIGRGGMGVVYHARDFLTGDDIALKRVLANPHDIVFSSRQQGSAGIDALHLSLMHEFRLLSSLRHPHIVPVLDYGFDNLQQPYLTMSLLSDALTLDKAIKNISLSQQITYLIQVLQALSYLHRQGILHRDLKPGNILIQDNTAFVLDFGLAHRVETTQRDDYAIGTLAYMAPEVLHGHPLDVRADLYSIGVIIYESLTGNHPFDTSDVTQLIYGILQKSPDLSMLDNMPSQQMVVGRLLSRDADDRYENASRVIQVLCEAFDLPQPIESIEIRESFLQSARFVGREAELTTLINALVKARSGQGDVILLGGESGAGKSRLLAEMRVKAQVQGMKVLSGQAFSEGGLSYQLWRNVVPHLILSVDVTAEEAAILQMIVPHIHRLLPGMKIASHPPENWQTRLPYIIIDMIQRTTEEQPILLILEDLQWAQEGLILLQSLVPSATNYPLLILASYRSDEAATLSESLPDATVINLQRLQKDEIRRLSQSMLGEAGRRDDVIALLEKESEGNIFFMVEVLRSLAENTGNLNDIGQVTLPAQVFAGGIQKIIQRRLERLPTWTQDMLQLAAVYGREIDSALLQLIQPDFDLQRWLNQCAEAAVLETSDGRWRFAHDKLRESIVDNLTSVTLQQCHQQIAKTLEKLHRDALSDYAAVLSYHYGEAKNTEKEGYYALIAAQQVIDFSIDDARKLAERALELKAYQYFETPTEKMAELMYLMGNIHCRINEYEVARKWQEQARDLYIDLKDDYGRAMATNVLGEIYHLTGKSLDGLPLVEEALAVFTQQNKIQEIFFALTNRGAIHYQLNDKEKALADFEEGYRVIQQIDDPVRMGQALNNLSLAYEMYGRMDEAITYHRKALILRRRVKHPYGIASSALNLGDILREQGDLEESETLLQEALHYAKLSGNRRALGLVYHVFSLLYRDREDFDSAIAYTNKQLDLARSMDNQRNQVIALRHSAELYLFTGKYDEARRLFIEAVVLVKPLDDLNTKLQLICAIARFMYQLKHLPHTLLLLLFLQHHETCETFIEETIQTVRTQLPVEIVDTINNTAQGLTVSQLLQTLSDTILKEEKHD